MNGVRICIVQAKLMPNDMRPERWRPFPLLPYAIICEEKHLVLPKWNSSSPRGRVFSPRSRPELDFDALATGIWSISPPRRVANCQLKLRARIFPAAWPPDGSRERTHFTVFLFLMRTSDFNFPTRWMRHLCNLIWQAFFCASILLAQLMKKPSTAVGTVAKKSQRLRLKESRLVLCVDTISSIVKGFWNNASEDLQRVRFALGSRQ
jgi:hypothetical protein